MVALLRCAALSISFSLMFGLVAQIYGNWKRKSCVGLSLLLIVMSFLAYSIWALYGASKSDNFLISSQTPGAILSLILLGQFYKYRHKVQSQKIFIGHYRLSGKLRATIGGTTGTLEPSVSQCTIEIGNSAEEVEASVTKREMSKISHLPGWQEANLEWEIAYAEVSVKKFQDTLEKVRV